MKKYVPLSVLLILFLAFSPARAGEEEEAAPVPADEEILARQDASSIISVNGRDIPRWMYDNALRDALARAAGENADVAEKQRIILHNLVDMEVLHQEAGERGMTVNLAGGVLRSKVIGRRYKSMDEFRRVLAGAGMTEKQFAGIWQQQASVNQLIDKVVLAGIDVSGEELRARYEQDKHKYARKPRIRASHILIQVAEESTDAERADARARLESLRRQVLDGGDFAELARETGGFPSAARGGDLGWFSRKRMAPAFSEAAFALPVDGVSEVVETRFGYHLIKKTGEQDPIPSLEEIGGQLSGVIRQEKGRAAFAAFKDGLVRRAEIVFHDPELEAAYGAQ